MTRPILFLAALAASCHSSPRVSVAPVTAGRRPVDSVRLITSDLPNFWRAYALAAGKDSAERVRIFRTVYLEPGSDGLRDLIRLRLMDRSVVRRRLIEAGWTAERIDTLTRRPRGTPGRDSVERAMEPLARHSAAEALVHALAQFPRYYAAIGPAALSLDTTTAVTGAIRRGLARLAELYPEARFPDVYFLIGNMSTGGTVGPSGMLIGTEHYASGPDTSLEELPEWFRPIIRANSVAALAGLVVHEAVHSLQPPHHGPNTLLRHALLESIPDLLTELAVGPRHADSERERYGRAHERAVWLDFKDEMATDSTIGTWMYNGRVPPDKNHGAVDIGYWVGYRIAQTYYERAADKPAAIHELLLLPDPERLLAESGYAAYAEALP